jgi:hypothetical protein
LGPQEPKREMEREGGGGGKVYLRNAPGVEVELGRRVVSGCVVEYR